MYMAREPVSYTHLDVYKRQVLYLALEDDYRRLQERLYRMFGVDGTDTLHFATCAKQLGAGLYEQLARFVSCLLYTSRCV